jgi:hypothetical protein
MPLSPEEDAQSGGSAESERGNAEPWVIQPGRGGVVMLKRVIGVGVVVVSLLASSAVLFAADLNDVVGVLPKFAIPMREVGDRFQNMYFAAKGGNWGLAFYMSKYMNNALNPAKLTKPDEYLAVTQRC